MSTKCRTRLYKMIWADGDFDRAMRGLKTNNLPTTVEISVPAELICQGCKHMVMLERFLTGGFCQTCLTTSRFVTVVETENYRKSYLPPHVDCTDEFCGCKEVGV